MEKKELLPKKKGFKDPLVQLCVNTPNSTTSEVLIDDEDVHDRIIARNIKNLSSAESSPLGLHSFLHNAIGLHGTSKFCDRALDNGLGDADKASINFTKVYKLLRGMARPHHRP